MIDTRCAVRSPSCIAATTGVQIPLQSPPIASALHETRLGLIYTVLHTPYMVKSQLAGDVHVYGIITGSSVNLSPRALFSMAGTPLVGISVSRGSIPECYQIRSRDSR